jgi:hypothetical protein
VSIHISLPNARSEITILSVNALGKIQRDNSIRLSYHHQEFVSADIRMRSATEGCIHGRF